MPKKTHNTYLITVEGRVQGVGFRPYVFRLAQEMKISGQINNEPGSVSIQINASLNSAEEFYKKLLSDFPERAEVTHSEIIPIENKSFEDFTIQTNTTTSAASGIITGDFALCDKCKLELLNPSNRRYKYPFISCVDCGPRYAISDRYPFERDNTSMVDFPMCVECENEYTDPTNRRFHAQTISCPSCGPSYYTHDQKGDVLDIITEAIKYGKIVAIKNTSGYLLLCDATNPNVITSLRKNKNRPHKPLAVVYPSLKSIREDFFIRSEEEKLLTSEIGPIVLLKNKDKLNCVAHSIAPGLATTGVMLPYSPILFLLLSELDQPIVATSGNQKGLPISASNEEAESTLRDVADMIVHHNLTIAHPQDDSVIKLWDSKEIKIRNSRGYAPVTFSLGKKNLPDTLALGADLKNTISVSTENRVMTSPYLCRINNYESKERLVIESRKFLDLYGIKPSRILIDLHPAYLTRSSGEDFSKKNKANLIEIPHHYAHFASVLAENDLFNPSEKVLGVIWDGMGYGLDGQIWGGEFLDYDGHSISRLLHWDYYPWLSGDRMSIDTRLSYFALSSSQKVKELFTSTEATILLKQKQNPKLLTSSIGRLFDAVSCCLGLVKENTYEGEAAMNLEQKSLDYDEIDLPLDLLPDFDGKSNPSPSALLDSIEKNLPTKSVSFLAASFHHTLAIVICKIAKAHNYSTIACSGGVFQNVDLLTRLQKLAASANLNLKINHKLSCNDENISHGQIMYDAFIN